MAGFSWPWIGAALLVIPLVVFFVVYIPYLQLGHSVAIPNTGPGYGWSLDELQAQMFGYHFGLQAGRPAASPWGAGRSTSSLSGSTDHPASGTAAWLPPSTTAATPSSSGGIPAILAGAVLAWRRRSYALALLVGAFVFQYLPWTRSRATFQYHYFTAVLFAMIAIAYLVEDDCQPGIPVHGDRLPGGRGGGGRGHLAAGGSLANARLVHQRGARAAALELRFHFPPPQGRASSPHGSPCGSRWAPRWCWRPPLWRCGAGT